MTSDEAPAVSIDVRLLVAAYLLEAAACILALSIYKSADGIASLTTREVMRIGGSSAVMLASGGYLLGAWFRSRSSTTRRFTFTIATNVVAVLLCLAAVEVVVRVFSSITPVGLAVAGTTLLPRSWDWVKTRNATLLETAPANISYFATDTLLGWTVGPSRRSKDGLYLSSVEGIRSPRVGMAYADCPASQRVALVGDSFTFGLEGPFEDSWGHDLAQELGSECAVLNFGVDGYGVDQAYLRYTRDVRPWHPAVTILGFIQHDLYRSLSVYSFITFPEWGMPFSKPRFVVQDGRLRLLNAPVISPDSILSVTSVTDLPFVAYDPGYDLRQWQWHAWYSLRLARYLVSRYPSYPRFKPEAGDAAMKHLNGELLSAFVRQAEADSTIPLVVYFPSLSDFKYRDVVVRDTMLAVLQRAGIAYLDMTACITDLGPEKAFIPGKRHYSAEGNRAIARCLLPVVFQRLNLR